MKIVSQLFFVSLMLGIAVSSSGQKEDEMNKQITSAISGGNAAALSVYFNSMIDLGIAGNEDSYSKTQATRILQDFFLKNTVKTYKVLRQGASTDGSQYSIGTMDAGGKNFRVYYLLKKVEGRNLILQFQIQTEK
jgi:hypothetical protein